MKTSRKKQFNPASKIRQHRLALGRTAQDIACMAGFSTSKILRIERVPKRARLGDVYSLKRRCSDSSERRARAPI